MKIFILCIDHLGTKLSEDSRKYGVENTCTTGNTLSKAASNFSRARAQMEKEHGNLLKALGTQVAFNLILTGNLTLISDQVLELVFIEMLHMDALRLMRIFINLED